MSLVALAILLVAQAPRWWKEAAAKRAAGEVARLEAEMYKDVWEFRRAGEPNEYTRYRSWCREAVLSDLKSPGSAKFVSMYVTLEEGRPTVLGDVDAQNGYGALIRGTYSCPFGSDGVLDSRNVLVFYKS